MKTIKKYSFVLFALLVGAVMQSCKEDIDTSDRYTFTQETLASYLEKHEVYSEYYRLLDEVPISSLSSSSVLQLISARGHYTVFAPTNDAIQLYLDSLYRKGIITEPSWEGFQSEEDLDSIQQVIVLNSIIDGGDDADDGYYTSSFPKDTEEFEDANLNERRLVLYIDKYNDYYINGTKDDNDSVIGGAMIDESNRDVPAINGVLHQMHGVIAPSNQTLDELLQDFLNNGTEYVGISNLIFACGLGDELSKYRDNDYEELYLTSAIQDITSSSNIGTAAAPMHRNYGYTIFAETDDFWQEELGVDVTTLSQSELASRVQDWVVAQGMYPDAVADENYDSEDNVLNQFITYHIIPARISSDKLVVHYSEKGYQGYDTEGAPYTIPVFEYQTTMGKRRLMKIYQSERDISGIYLNRFPSLDNGRDGSYRENSCDDDKQGFLINTASAQNVINGYIYPISKVGGSGAATLAYNEDTRNNLQKERIRFDVSTIFPEFLSNNIKMTRTSTANSSGNSGYGYWGFPIDEDYQYLSNLSIMEGTNFCYLPGVGYSWQNYQGDEFNVTGNYEMTFTLPPVPKSGTYEIRYAVQSNSSLRGMCQVYFGTNPDNLSAMGIPLDLRFGRTSSDLAVMGWEEDVSGDDDYNAEIDKKMRNYGFMKGPEYYNRTKGASVTARGNQYTTRRIIVRQDMDPDKTYYLKFKSVMEDTSKEFYMDYLEFCAKEVYDNPETGEDIW